MTSEEAYFVAEMARGIDGAVAGKVFSSTCEGCIDSNFIAVYQ
jgi:hypothetical protein